MCINMTTVDALTAVWNGKLVDQTSKAFEHLELMKSVPELKHLGDFACKHRWFPDCKNVNRWFLHLWGLHRGSVPVAIPYYDAVRDRIFWSVDANDCDQEAFRKVADINAKLIVQGYYFDVTTRCMIRYLSNNNTKPLMIPLDTSGPKESRTPPDSSDEEL